MTDFEIVEIENEYIREQLQIAQQQRIRQLQIEEQERIVEREELERIAEAQRLQLENEQLLAERIEDITENEIENRVLNIENAIFAQNLAEAIRRIIPYRPMGPIPINIIPPMNPSIQRNQNTQTLQIHHHNHNNRSIKNKHYQ